MTQQDYINSLIERETHSATMKALSPLEREHLKDWRAYFEQRAFIEAVDGRPIEHMEPA